MEHKVDAAVLGAGIAGSCLAKALADKGWNTLLLDRQSFPRHKVCGEFLSPEAQSTLRAFGLAETVAELEPVPIERSRLIFSGGAEIGLPLPGIAWGLSRYRLDERLHRAAEQAGARLESAMTVTSVRREGADYVLEAKRAGQSLSLRARAVIAAWGANPRAGLPGGRRTGDGRGQADDRSSRVYFGVKSHFQGISMEPVVEMYFFRGGYLGLCPVGEGRVNAAALLEREEFANAGRSLTAFIEEASRRNPKLAGRLAGAVPVEGTQAAVAPVQLKRRPLTWDTLPLLGDAASMIAPLCGDGMSMALRSAALCAPLADRYLRGELTMDGWEREYTGQIRAEFNGPLRWGSMMQLLLGLPGAGRLLPGAARLAPGLAQQLMQATRLKTFHTFL